MNGILGAERGPSLPTLLLLLNSRLLDWIFRRGSAHHANDYYAANKQFIAGLPIRIPSGAEAVELHALGQRLHELAASVADERGAFLRWLASTVGAGRVDLLRRSDLAGYDGAGAARVVAALARMRAHLAVDPRERAVRELIEREHRESVERLRPLLDELAISERDADEHVYALPTDMRAQVDSEYEP